MHPSILISARRLDSLLQKGGAIVVDCRFDLSDPGKGRRDWIRGHVPGAFYAHLDDDLSSPVTAETGRHPLPDTKRFAAFLGSIGWTPGTLLVAYDEGPGAIAVRLWWLMRYYGLDAALLDGGLAAWTEAGLPLDSRIPAVNPTPAPELTENAGMLVSTADLEAAPESVCLLDARAAERFRGEFEPLDTKAGHIPGAVNRPYSENLGEDGLFREPDALREDFLALLEGRGFMPVAHSCGSGVTACHNLFAMELAGLSGSLLYPGSWSEWIRDPARPIATGD